MGVVTAARSVVDVARDRNVTFLAASFAYYAFVSLFPLVLLTVAVGTYLGGEAFTAALLAQVETFLSSEGAQLLERTLSDASGQAGASAASLVVLLWSALKLFRGLVVAFEELYETAPEAGFLDQVKKALVTLLAVTLGVALMVAVGALLGTGVAADIPFAGAVGGGVLFVGLVPVFLALYYVLPPVDVQVREALPGAVFAAVGWLVLQGGFQLYAGGSGKYGLYGLLGAVILFLTWLYFAGILLLLGAVVNLVLARR